MSYLVDSDWVADYLRGRPAAVTLLDGLWPDGLALSVITCGEIYEGIHYGSDPPRYDAVFRSLLSGVQVLDIDLAVAQRFALVRGLLRARGRPIGDADLLISATALHHDLALVTRNRRHFERIPDLKLHGDEP